MPNNIGIDVTKKTVQVSQKSMGLKKPPLPLPLPAMPKIYEKVILNQVSFKMEF